MLGRGKRLNCALRAEKARGTMEKSIKVNLENAFPSGKAANRIFYGEFDSGSERTLAACLRHASRTGRSGSNTLIVQWRTGE